MLQVWNLTVRMKDFGKESDRKLMNLLASRLAMKFSDSLPGRGNAQPEFTHDGNGTIRSGLFRAELRSELPEWWNDGFFPKQREFEILAMTPGSSRRIHWGLKGGVVRELH